MKATVLVGKRFGSLVVVAREVGCRVGNRRWHVRCDCGRERVIGSRYLTASRPAECLCEGRKVPRVPLADRFWAKVNKDGPVVRVDLGPCWVWTAATNEGGYGIVLGPSGSSDLAHRVSWLLMNGPIADDRPCVCHHCDNPPCVNPAHMYLGTRYDNNVDKGRKRRGRSATGEASPHSKLTEADVFTIRRLAALDVTTTWMACTFGVSRGAINFVRDGSNWQHVA